MAQKIQTVFVDDLDGSEAEGTVRFGLDGSEYEIDLNAGHAQALREALAPYVSAARRGPGRRPGKEGRSGSVTGAGPVWSLVRPRRPAAAAAGPAAGAPLLAVLAGGPA